MTEHICVDCKFRTEAESVYDYFLKTGTYPELRFWKNKDFEDKYWLCESPDVSDVIHTNGSLKMKRCFDANRNGECPFFCVHNPENIIPSRAGITAERTDFSVGDEASPLEVTVYPLENEDGIPNDQSIKYSFQWYRNGRKLFNETSSVLAIDTSKAYEYEYMCEVTQSIPDNGDGGKKTAVTDTDSVTIKVTDETN